MHILDDILESYKLDILCMCKANITPYFMKYLNKYQEYNFEVSTMYHTIGTSRNFLVVKNTIPYTQRNCLKNNILSTKYFFFGFF